MTVTAVEEAIRHARKALEEWGDICEENWPGENPQRANQTCYAIIDPVIRALGWDTC